MYNSCVEGRTRHNRNRILFFEKLYALGEFLKILYQLLIMERKKECYYYYNVFYIRPTSTVFYY